MYTEVNKNEICHLRDFVGGYLFEYSLSESEDGKGAPDGYYINARIAHHESSDERTVFVGHDRKRAIGIFKLIAYNAVSPCALDDVLADIETADLMF